MRIRSALIAVLAGVLFAVPAYAHRIGIPVTTIDYNQASDKWEVVHRLSAHDFDKLMASKISPAKLYASQEGLAQIEDYTETAFRLTGEGAELVFIGAELDRDMVWIYYELESASEAIEIDSNLLMGTGRTSHALVNISGRDGVTSLIFTPTDGPKRVQLTRPLP